MYNKQQTVILNNDNLVIHGRELQWIDKMKK